MKTQDEAIAAAQHLAQNKKRSNASSNWHVVKVYSRLDKRDVFLVVPSPRLFKMYPGIQPNDPDILYATGG